MELWSCGVVELWRAVESCGELWRAVESCGELWKAVESCGELSQVLVTERPPGEVLVS